MLTFSIKKEFEKIGKEMGERASFEDLKKIAEEVKENNK